MKEIKGTEKRLENAKTWKKAKHWTRTSCVPKD